MPIDFCGCKNHCAEEDGVYTRPNERGVCELFHKGHSPTTLAEEIFGDMSVAERSTAIRQGAANVEDRVKGRVPEWAYSAIEACLDEITRLCVDAEEGI